MAKYNPVTGQLEEEIEKTTGFGAESMGFPSDEPQAPTPGAQATPSSPVAQQQRSQHVNVQDYVAANTGAGQEMAGQVRGKVEGGIQGAQSAVDKAQKQLTDLAGQEANKYSQAGGIAQQIDEDATQFSGLSGQEELPEPPQYQYSVDDVHYLTDAQAQAEALRGIYDQVSESAYGSRQAAEDAANLAGKVRTEQGRYDLLRQSLGGAGYTTGEQRLDQTLVQSEGRDALRKLQEDALREVSGLEGTYNKYAEDIGSQFDQESDESLFGKARAARETVGGAIGQWGPQGTGEFGQLYGELSDRAAQIPEEYRADYDAAIQQWLTDPTKLTPKQLEQLGAFDPNMMYIGGTPPSDLLDPNLSRYGLDIRMEDGRLVTPTGEVLANAPDLSGFTNEALMGNVASEGDRARLAALRELGRSGETEALLGEGEELPGFDLNKEKIENAFAREKDRRLNLIRNTALDNSETRKQAKYFSNSPQDAVDFLNKTRESSDINGIPGYAVLPNGKIGRAEMTGGLFSQPTGRYIPFPPQFADLYPDFAKFL